MEWITLLCCFLVLPMGFYLVSSTNPLSLFSGMVLMGLISIIITQRMGHLATHYSLCDSRTWGKLWLWISTELCGAFSDDLVYVMHVKIHHPHTNIIGLGDSSAWKIPILPCYLYMFVAPLFLPVATPLFSISMLIQERMWFSLLKFIPSASAGIVINAWLYVYFSGYSWLGAFVILFASRSIFMIPYIHMNIFQHIGLPMYDKAHRPKRLYQMATGCLNVYTNPLLNVCLGPSLVDCHVEHHLFPNLSDSLCLKVKPLVSEFCRKNGLPYQQDSYINRLSIFVKRYNELMVHAPPITHFIGIQ
ncbi:fatty acid desaturase 6-like [Tubulanus polymorphus]|uniref:fatty acid desaturase 6-like n=1 Tax=Tubulanus polymorphus TaxID=672921 RepID=UPI003DA5F7C9